MCPSNTFIWLKRAYVTEVHMINMCHKNPFWRRIEVWNEERNYSYQKFENWFCICLKNCASFGIIVFGHFWSFFLSIFWVVSLSTKSTVSQILKIRKKWKIDFLFAPEHCASFWNKIQFGQLWLWERVGGSAICMSLIGTGPTIWRKKIPKKP